MKKILFALTIALLFCLTAFAVSAKEYYIYTPEDMYNVRNDLEGTYYLMNDIDLSGYENWEPIGKMPTISDGKWNCDLCFSGIFDGQGHEISGIHINRAEDYQGLFGYVRGGTIKNLGVVDSYVNGMHYVGGVVGNAESSSSDFPPEHITLSNCYNTGTISGKSHVGGVVGYNDDAIINNCYNTGNISGKSEVGGVVGKLNKSLGNNCYNTGKVIGSEESTGGVIGESNDGFTSYCYNVGVVCGDKNVGGIIGFHTESILENSYNIGVVTGNSYVGGVVGAIGLHVQTPVANCYYLTDCAKDGNGVIQYGIGNETQGATTIDVSNQTISLNSEEIKDASSLSNFDFTTIWAISFQYNDGYPYLQSTPSQLTEIKVLVNNSQIQFDVPPTIIDGRTLVPLRAIFEALGATVEWNGVTKTITGTKENTTIIIVVGEDTFTVNGESKTLDVPPQIIDSRTLVPARAIAESFGVNVEWNGEERSVYIG